MAARNHIKYVNRKSFISEVNKFKKQNRVSTSKIAKNSGLSMSYAYHLVSPKEQRPVTVEAARSFGKGLELNARQANEWNTRVLGSSNRDDFFQPAMIHVHSDKKPSRSLASVVKAIMNKKSLNTLVVADRSGLDVAHVNKFLSGSLQLSKIDEARLARGLNTDYKHLEALRTKKPANKKSGAMNRTHYAPQKAINKTNENTQTKASKANTFAKPARPTASSGSANDTANLRPDVLALAKRINQLSMTDTDIVRLVTDRLMSKYR